MSENEFVEADAIAEVVVENKKDQSLKKRDLPSDVVEYRTRLVEQYHQGAPSLTEKLRKQGKEDIESLLVALIEEVIKETDHLLGNELVATQNGELRDSSIISFKRAEVIEKAIKAVQSKQEFERDGGVDVDSPAVVVIYRFFMEKVKETFERMGVGSETNDLFFRTMPMVMDGWKKELKIRFEELRQKG